MTTVVIPAVQDASGTTLPARASIALVDENHQPILGWETGDGRPVYEQLAFEIPEEGLEVDLLPQSGVGLPGGAATYYAVSIAPFGRAASLHYVQVPDSETAVPLISLIGATALSPADILAGRLVPVVPDEATTGWSITVDDNGAPAWTDVPPGSGISDAPAVGGAFGRAAGEWAPVFAVSAQFAELDTPEARAAARQNLELQTIDGGTFT